MKRKLQRGPKPPCRFAWAWQSVRAFVLIAAICCAQTSGNAQGAPGDAQTKIVIKSPRPLAEALDRVQELVGAPINYEELPYENPADLWRSTSPPLRPGVVGPRGGQITVDVGPFLSDARLAVQAVLGAYAGAGLPGVYNLVQNNGHLDVVPALVLGGDGSMRAVTPVMNSPVAFPYAERPVLDTLQMIADLVSKAARTRVLLLNTPFHESDRVALGASNEPAGDAIANVLAKFGPMSYRLLYDPQGKTYYLNLKPVPASLPPSVTLTPPPARPLGHPPESPWFRKK